METWFSAAKFSPNIPIHSEDKGKMPTEFQ